MEVREASNEFSDGIDLEKELADAPVMIVPPSFCGVCGGKGGTIEESKVKNCRVYTRTGLRVGRIFEYKCCNGECEAVCGSSVCTMPGL